MEEDRISELPDSLLIHILSLLPSIEEVIRTGTLSKRWLHLWTFVPNLTFFPNLLFASADRVLPNGECERFVSDVNRTLVQSRVSKIEEFDIVIPYCTSIASDVDSWIHFATKNNVDHLALCFINMSADDVYILPQYLYTNLSLKILKLLDCIVAPVGLIRWKSLKSLCLQDIKLSNAVMEGILLGCPVLEILEVRCYGGFNRLKVASPSLRELVLCWCQYTLDDEYDDSDGGDAYLEISAPNLRTLTISSCFYTSNIRLEDVKSLVVADLSFSLNIHYDVYNTVEEDKYCNLLQELIEKLRHVKELKLATWCIQVLSVLEVKALPSPLLHCKSLTLEMGIADNDLPGIAKVLDISPYLEKLVVNCKKFEQRFVRGCLFDANSIDRENYLQLRKTIPEGSLLQLKNVKIFGFRRAHSEVELIQFLLKNAKVLENMNIYLQTDSRSECPVWREIVDEELNLPASSPRAVVRLFEFPKNSCKH